MWDEAAFIDFSGYSHRINHDNSALSKKLSKGLSVTRADKTLAIATHNGTSTVVDKNKVQIPTVIPAGARVNTIIIPADNAAIVRFDLTKYEVATIYEDDDQQIKQKKEERIEKKLSEYQARSAETAIKLLLPIEVDGTKIEYTATFVDEFQRWYKSGEDAFGDDVEIGVCFVAVIILAPLIL